MRLFGCRHKWKVVDSEPFIDTSYGFRIPSTKLLYECKKCGWHKDQSVGGHYGYYSVEEIIKKHLRDYIIACPEEVTELIKDVIKENE